MPRWLNIALIAVLVIGLVVAIAAPIGPLPGFRLGGSEAAAPESWAGQTLPDEVKLETGAGFLPRVVIIWVVEHAGRLHVIGSPDSTWVQAATEVSDVRLRIEDDVYDMRANRLPPGQTDVVQKYLDRYRPGYPDIVGSFPPFEEFAQGAAVFELVNR